MNPKAFKIIYVLFTLNFLNLNNHCYADVFTNPCLNAVPTDGEVESAITLRKGIEIWFIPNDFDWSGESGINIDGPSFSLRIFKGGIEVPSSEIHRGDLTLPPRGHFGYEAINSVHTSSSAIDAIKIVYNYTTPPLGNEFRIEIEGVTDALGGTMTVGYDFCASPTPPCTTPPCTVIWTFRTESTPPRDPRSIVLVLDRSGSMTERTVPSSSSSRTKIEALHRAAGIFFDTIPPYAIPGDNLGLVFFNQDKDPERVPPASPMDAILVDLNDDAMVNTLRGIMLSERAEGSTSIGDGLLSAQDDGFRMGSNAKSILLFSDGKQNTIELIDETILLMDDSRRLRIGSRDLPEDIDIYSLTIGINGGSARREVMQALANKRGNGQNYDVDFPDFDPMREGDLQQHFLDVLGESIVGDKLEIVKRLFDVVERGVPEIHEFTISALDRRLSIIISWPDTVQFLPIKLKSPLPNSVEFVPTDYIISRQGYTVLTLPLPFVWGNQLVSQQGDWQLIIDTSALLVPTAFYNAIILADNKNIASLFQFDGHDFGTGENIPLKVTLKEAGVPITGATVIAEVTSPGDGVGNVLREDISVPPDGAVDSRSPVERKLWELLNNREILERLSQHTGPRVDLRDDDGDGVYTGNFNDTQKEGYYNFTFKVEGNTPDNSRFTRTKKVSLHIRTKPSPTTTEAEAEIIEARPDNSGAILLSFTPFDALRNYLGPGYTNFIQVTTTEGTLVGSIVDKLNGSYEQRIELADLSQNPNIKVSVRGTEVVNAPLSELKPDKFPKWLLILILLLLIILIVWFIFFRRRRAATP